MLRLLCQIHICVPIDISCVVFAVMHQTRNKKEPTDKSCHAVDSEEQATNASCESVWTTIASLGRIPTYCATTSTPKTGEVIPCLSTINTHLHKELWQMTYLTCRCSKTEPFPTKLGKKCVHRLHVYRKVLANATWSSRCLTAMASEGERI